MKKKTDLAKAIDIAKSMTVFQLGAITHKEWILAKETCLMSITGLKKEEAKYQLDYLLTLRMPIDDLFNFYIAFGKFPNEDEMKALRIIGFYNYCRLHFVFTKR